MQLSFPSVPSDPTGAVAPGASQASGTGTSDANDGVTPFGFAQVLAGVAPSPSSGQPTAPATAGSVLSPIAASPTLLNGLLPASIGPGQTGVLAVVGGVSVDVATLGTRAIGIAPPGVAKSDIGGSSAPASPRGSEKKGLAEVSDLQAMAVAVGLLPTAVPPPAPNLAKETGPADAKVDGATGPVLDLGTGARTSARIGVAPLGGAMGRSITGASNSAPQAPSPLPSGKSDTPAAPVFEAPENAVPAQGDRVAPELPKTGLAELKGSLAGMPATQAPDSTAGQGAGGGQSDQVQPGATGIAPDLRSISDTNIARAVMPEKIAATVAPPADPVQSPIGSGTKSTLSPQRKGVAQADPAFGIGVAKHDATMPAGSTFARSPVSEAPPVVASASIADARSSTDSVPQPVVLTSSAHRAVEAVLDATDRFAARDQHSVNLQFSVGGTDLNVRVELRSGEVHTTFRTDSPELRAALSSEWNSMTSQQNGDRSTKLANPVFTANAQAGSSTSFSGDGTSRQRDSQARDAATQNSGFAGMRRAPASTSTSSNSNSPMTRSVAVNSVHLHTLA